MLTDVQIRKIKPREKAFKLTDSLGLHLYVPPTGRKVWRYKYRFDGKEKLLTIGEYPAISLSDARKVRDEARAEVKAKRDPADLRRRKHQEERLEAGRTFEIEAREWFEINKSQWAEKHAADVLRSLEKEAFPEFGSTPVKDITALKVLDMLRKVEKRGAVDTARRIRQRCSHVFQFCIAKGICESDPAAQVEKAMAPLKRGRQPAVTTLEGARDVIRKADQTPGHPVTKLANRLLALTALRPGTLITTPWSEFEDLDEDDPVWVIPAARMKLRLEHKNDERRDHLVPLSPQAVETIKALHSLTGRGPYVLPNSRHAHKPMSENAIGYLLNRAGYYHKHVPHGWRAAFSTVMNEKRPDDRQIIDLTLAHVPKDRIEAAYNRALYLKQRKEILRDWANILMANQLPVSEVIKLPRRVNKGLALKS